MFSEAGVGRPPRSVRGTVTTRRCSPSPSSPTSATPTHTGGSPAASDFKLPAELNECHVMHASALILATLIGDELLNAVGRTNKPFAAMYEGEDLLEALAEAIIPAVP